MCALPPARDDLVGRRQRIGPGQPQLPVGPVLGAVIGEMKLVDRRAVDRGELAYRQRQHVELVAADTGQGPFETGALIVLQVQREPVRRIGRQFLSPPLQQSRRDDRQQQQRAQAQAERGRLDQAQRAPSRQRGQSQPQRRMGAGSDTARHPQQQGGQQGGHHRHPEQAGGEDAGQLQRTALAPDQAQRDQRGDQVQRVETPNPARYALAEYRHR